MKESFWQPSVKNKEVNKQQITENFHMSDILSVLTGLRLSTPSDGAKGLHAILSFMIGSKLDYLYQIPDVIKICKPAILKQHPDLATALETVVDMTDNDSNWNAWLQKQIQIFGKDLPINQIPLDKIPSDILNLINPIPESGQAQKMNTSVLKKY